MAAPSQALTIFLVAEEAAGARVLAALARGPHRLVGVATSPPGVTPQAGTPWKLAQKLGCPVHPARAVTEPPLADLLRREQVDVLLNVHSLFILPAALLAVPRIGSFNLHPGPLPRYAGLNAPSWAIYRGESHHGVTIHHMEPAIDTGALAYQACFPITENDTGLTLSARCAEEGCRLMDELLATAATAPAAIPRVPQDLSRREYFGRSIPQQGRVEWDRPARYVHNLLRAADYFPFASPWGHPKTWVRGRELGIVKASLAPQTVREAPGTVLAKTGTACCVACAEGAVQVQVVHLDGHYLLASQVLQPGDQCRPGPELAPSSRGCDSSLAFGGSP